ncbi:hypothetical protein llap_19122 [Limosa lapponica baueri]|uniref:Uncharacterized protein n=1 Tax=Limosa lapponica baueri TaxID=1758121 RepID=A0A2I0T9V8_LIMLA|nr:hypothetical protein llap_19122 [Limosa lapponica baueri]
MTESSQVSVSVSPRTSRKDFAADLYRVVLMTLTPMLSFTGGSDAGMRDEIYYWFQLNLELPVAACPRYALAKQRNEDSGSNIPETFTRGDIGIFAQRRKRH